MPRRGPGGGWLAEHDGRPIIQVGYDMEGSKDPQWPTRQWAKRAEREVSEGYGLGTVTDEEVFLLGAEAPRRDARLKQMYRG